MDALPERGLEEGSGAMSVVAVRPAIFDRPRVGMVPSHAAVAMQDYSSSKWFAERGLAANPNDSHARE